MTPLQFDFNTCLLHCHYDYEEGRGAGDIGILILLFVPNTTVSRTIDLREKSRFFPRSQGKIPIPKGKIPSKLNYTNPT